MAKVQTKNIRDAYEPGKILKHLNDLHPLFYPIPVDEKLDSDGALDAIIPVKKNSLTKSDLPKLYGLCGNILHQGPIAKFDPNKEWNYRESAAWVNKIIALLNRHLIVLSDKTRAIYVMMQAKETGKITLLDLSISDSSHWPDWFRDLQKEE
jgi:hypothetical protein